MAQRCSARGRRHCAHTAGASLLVATAATALTLLDVTVVYLALPVVGSDLRATFAQQQWVVDAYAVAVASALLVLGAVADRRGRRIVFLAGLGVFGVASAACAAAPSGVALDAARAVQGLGAAALLSTSLALIGEAYDGAARARALGIWGAASGAALAAGPVVGGVVLDLAGWRWVFALNLPVVLVLAAITRRQVPETRDPGAPPADLAGAAVLSVALGLLVAGVLRAPVDGWGSTSTMTLLVASASLLVAFVLLELRRPAPVLDPRLLRDRAVAATAGVSFLQSVAIYPVLLFLAADLQALHGFTPLQAGVRVLPITLTLLVAAAVAGRLTAHLPERLPLAAGLVGVAAGLLLMRGARPGDAWTGLLPGFLVFGAGTGVVSPSLAAAIMAMLPVRRGGLASGLGNTARQAGIAVGVGVLGAVFAAGARTGEMGDLLRPRASEPATAVAFLQGVDAVLLAAAGAALAGAAVALFIPPGARRS